MAHKDGGDQHVDRHADDPGLYVKGEIPGYDLVPDGTGRDQVTRKRDASKLLLVLNQNTIGFQVMDNETSEGPMLFHRGLRQ